MRISALIIFMSAAFAVCSLQARAFVGFENIQVYEIENGTAKIKWSTPCWQTKGTVYFGENPDDLNRYIGYSLYNYYHETILTGLKKDKKYYFKIIAIDRLENEEESFLQSFSTKGMEKEDLIKPQFKEQKILQTINDATAVYWTTNEETRAVIYYGAEGDGLNKTAKANKFQEEHELLIQKLKPGTRYNLKIVAEDKSGNKTNGRFFTFNTGDYKNEPEPAIFNVNPLSPNEKSIFSRRITIDFKTNLVARSIIQYGVVPGKYKKKVAVSEFRQLNHRITLTDLQPETMYYYKITAYDSFGKKKIITPEMTFVTKTFRKQFANGSLVKGSGYKVYVITGNEKFWIESGDVFNKLGYKWEWIETTDNVFLNEYKEGKSIASSKSHPDGTLIKYPDACAVYLIENGKKRPFSSAESFLKRGYSWDRIITISTKEKYKNGEYL